VRLISNWLGRAEQCTRPRCRRAKLCRADRPDCWSEEPEPTDDELDLAKGMMKRHFGEALRDARQRDFALLTRPRRDSRPLRPARVPLARRGS
jgi:hypothetical protein